MPQDITQPRLFDSCKNIASWAYCITYHWIYFGEEDAEVQRPLTAEQLNQDLILVCLVSWRESLPVSHHVPRASVPTLFLSAGVKVSVSCSSRRNSRVHLPVGSIS